MVAVLALALVAVLVLQVRWTARVAAVQRLSWYHFPWAMVAIGGSRAIRLLTGPDSVGRGFTHSSLAVDAALVLAIAAGLVFWAGLFVASRRHPPGTWPTGNPVAAPRE